MVIPPETHFFHSYQNLKKKFEKSQNHKLFRNKLIESWYGAKTRIRDLGLSKNHILETSEKLDLTSPLDLFTLQLTMYRAERDKSIVGEKTPRHTLHVPEILEAYPDAKIISLFRDPRATSYSEIKVQFGSPSVIVSAKRWKKYAQVHERLQQELPNHQYMMLRYSDLIENVEGTLKTICEFLEVPFEEQMLEYYERDEKGFAEGEKSWKKETLEPVRENKNEEWKSALNDWQIALIEDTVGEYLEKFNYETWNGYSPGFSKKLFWQCVDFSRSVWATLSGSRKEGYIDPDKFKL